MYWKWFSKRILNPLTQMLAEIYPNKYTVGKVNFKY